MNEVKHDGVVIKVYDDCMRVVINIGHEQGVKEGFRYLVFGLGDELTDPETGRSLGIPEDIRGKGTATHVQSKITTITSTEKQKSRRIQKVMPSPLTGLSGLLSQHTEVIEEEVTEIPFINVQEGDYVRDITTGLDKIAIAQRNQ